MRIKTILHLFTLKTRLYFCFSSILGTFHRYKQGEGKGINETANISIIIVVLIRIRRNTTKNYFGLLQCDEKGKTTLDMSVRVKYGVV